MRSRLMLFLAFSALLLLSSCAGGSRGTGDLTFNGKVQLDNGEPIANALVSLLSSGDQALTDATGAFVLNTTPFTGSPTFLIETGGDEIRSEGGEITEDAIEVTVTIRVTRPTGTNDRPVAHQEVEIHRRRTQDGGGNGGQASSHESGGSGSGGGNDHSGSNNGTGHGSSGTVSGENGGSVSHQDDDGNGSGGNQSGENGDDHAGGNSGHGGGGGED